MKQRPIILIFVIRSLALCSLVLFQFGAAALGQPVGPLSQTDVSHTTKGAMP
jgi:hypothetical protein